MRESTRFIEEKLAVPKEFESVFSDFYAAENSTSCSLDARLLPSFQSMLVFCFGKAASLSPADGPEIQVENSLLIPAVKKLLRYTLPAESKLLVINFKGDALFRFFGQALEAELKPVNPDELLPENCFAQLHARLAELNSLSEQMAHILAFCRPYLSPAHPSAELLWSLSDSPRNPVKLVAEQSRKSERTVQLLQKRQFGYSQKELSRYRRFMQAVDFIRQALDENREFSWMELCYACGYYDQSQLIHDFQFYLQLSPTQFLAFTSSLCRV